MRTFLQSLLSRKFLLAVGTALVFIANGAYTEAVAVILGFLGVEGAADAVSRSKAPVED
jgi:hypothetical protein